MVAMLTKAFDNVSYIKEASGDVGRVEPGAAQAGVHPPGRALDDDGEPGGGDRRTGTHDQLGEVGRDVVGVYAPCLDGHGLQAPIRSGRW